MKVSLLYLGMLFLIVSTCLTTYGQLSLTNANNSRTIDFSTTIAGVNNGAYTGAGFQPAPTTGQLDSDAWASTGMSDGALVFGGTATAGDYARGATATAESTGGFYAYTGAPGSVANPSFMFQPTAADFTPGTLTLRIQNNGTTDITQFDASYDILFRDDQNYSSSLTFSYSLDGTNFTTVPAINFATPEGGTSGTAFASGGRVGTTVTLTGTDRIAPSEFFFIRWTSDDAAGTTGSRDEIAIDNITVNATFEVVTSAMATISGRVVNSKGRAISFATVLLTGGNMAEPKYARTNSSGYYNFSDVSVGENYVVSVMSKNYFFKEPSKVISVNENLADVDFIGYSRH